MAADCSLRLQRLRPTRSLTSPYSRSSPRATPSRSSTSPTTSTATALPPSPSLPPPATQASSWRGCPVRTRPSSSSPSRPTSRASLRASRAPRGSRPWSPLPSSPTQRPCSSHSSTHPSLRCSRQRACSSPTHSCTGRKRRRQGWASRRCRSSASRPSRKSCERCVCATTLVPRCGPTTSTPMATRPLSRCRSSRTSSSPSKTSWHPSATLRPWRPC
uniref:Uncharacterized protein n=1 Tax=Zea mays TaxID=4577 RepID=B7ZZ00_MAIZE|nr:unknown [Zea mays]|eukprot:NP_001146069.1 uncharacterized LOC100279600 [Zea mays]